jgi:peptidoglycan/LPS O-acetylase OafA/YrhL
VVTAEKKHAQQIAGEDRTLRFAFVDGLRGITALYVAYFHAYQMQYFTGGGDVWHSTLIRYSKVLCMGHYAVAVFIALSGFCLMQPLVATRSIQFPDAFIKYMKRRAKRVLPGFYAAILLSLAVAPLCIEIVRWPEVAATIFLVGNYAERQIGTNSPLWSVATEWQIYLLFPLVLLPTLRKTGIAGLLMVATLIGVVPFLLWPKFTGGACPWFLIVFTLGMIGALISCDSSLRMERVRQLPWGWMALVALASFALLGLLNLGVYKEHLYLVDPFLGFGIMCLLVYCRNCLGERRRSLQHLVFNCLSTRTMVFLGSFSYSVYLVHYPLLRVIQPALVRKIKYLFAADVILLLLGVPLIACCAYVFYRLFERPFLTPRKTR